MLNTGTTRRTEIAKQNFAKAQLRLGNKNVCAVGWVGCLSLLNSQRIVQCHMKCNK